MIDRSNPLPIHQFPNLINEVARLKELAANDAPGAFTRYMCEELHAAPDMLAVLSGFQAGDAEKLDMLIYQIKTAANLPIDFKIGIDWITEILARHRDMAHAMEDA